MAPKDPSNYVCPLCSRQFQPQGYASHFKKCQRDHQPNNETLDQQYEADFCATLQAQEDALHEHIYAAPPLMHQGPTSAASSHHEHYNEPAPPALYDPKGKRRAKENDYFDVPYGSVEVTKMKNPLPSKRPLVQVQPPSLPSFSPALPNITDDSPLPPSQYPPEPGFHGYNEDDIRTTFHPSLGKPPRIEPFEKFGLESAPSPPPYHPMPWLPFRSESEFSFAEIVHKTAMPSGQITALIKVVQRLLQDRSEHFLFESSKDLNELWATAVRKHVPFEKKDITVSYAGITASFPFWNRSLDQWARSILADPYLGKVADFESKVYHKLQGDKWIRFITGPQTADRMWGVQDQIPPNARPLLITLYSDKTRVASFDGKECHPIMARIDNLPQNIVNGAGLGAVQVVGWIPVFQDDPAQTGKAEYVNFKKAVYHECYKHLLSMIVEASHIGALFDCAGQNELLVPFIFILAADFEEQSVMTLTRGVKSLYPCTKCEIHKDKLSDLTVKAPRRDVDAAIALYNECTTVTKAARETRYSQKGLRFVKNAFWTVRFSSPFLAVSFDELHNNCHGLGGKHLWKEVKRVIDTLPASQSRILASKIGKQFEAFPRWPNLNHFGSTVLQLQFSDGNKFWDVMKLFIYASHNVLGTNVDTIEYQLLCVIRKYIEMVMWELLEVHTTETIQKGRQAVLAFGTAINLYDDTLLDLLPGYAPENADNDDIDDEMYSDDENDDEQPLTQKRMRKYNFPKLHNQTHAFDDVEEKGPLRNYSTRLFEGRHKPLKKTHQNKTNFKDSDRQILEAEHIRVVLEEMRQQINFNKEFKEHWDSRDTEGELEFLESDKTDDDEFAQSYCLLGTATSLEMPEDNSMSNANNNDKLFGNILLRSPDTATTSFDEIEDKHRDDPNFQRFCDRSIEVLTDIVLRADSGVNISMSKETFKARLRSLKGAKMIKRYKFVKVTYESMVDWRAHFDLLCVNPTWHGTGRFDTVIYNTGSGHQFARLLFVFTVKLAPEMHNSDKAVYISLALIKPFLDKPRSSKKDADLHLLRLKESPTTQIIPARSIVRGAYLVSDGSDSRTHLIMDTVDSDMFLRIQQMYPSPQ